MPTSISPRSHRFALTFTAGAIAACALVPAAPAAPAKRLYCLDSAGSKYVAKRAPSRCAAFGPGGSFGGGVNLASLRWSGWGRATAKATGIERGFHLPYARTRVSVRAYRLVRGCGGRRVYSRLKASSRHGTTTVRLPTCSRRA
jgi:hypothetical protein